MENWNQLVPFRRELFIAHSLAQPCCEGRRVREPVSLQVVVVTQAAAHHVLLCLGLPFGVALERPGLGRSHSLWRQAVVPGGLAPAPGLRVD